MITILFITFIFYLIAELVKQGAAQKARKREAQRQARIEAEMRRDREAREQIAREQKEQREAMIAYEKEMRRLHLEQMREEKERQRLEAEQARQAAILAKHEQRIADLEYRVQQAESDIDHWKQTVGNLYALRDVLMNELEQAIVGGKNQTKYQKQIITLDNQIHSAETRLAKAKYTKAKAEQELQAA